MKKFIKPLENESYNDSLNRIYETLGPIKRNVSKKKKNKKLKEDKKKIPLRLMYPINRTSNLTREIFENNFNDKMLRIVPEDFGPLNFQKASFVFKIDGPFIYICGKTKAKNFHFVRFDTGSRAIVLQLNEKNYTFGEYEVSIAILVEGKADICKGTLAFLELGTACIPVGASLLGRILGPTGNVLDFRLPYRMALPRRMHSQRIIQPIPHPSEMMREKNVNQIGTGTFVLDTFFPLIEGDVHGFFGPKEVNKYEVITRMIKKQRLDSRLMLEVAKVKNPLFIYCLPHTTRSHLSELVHKIKKSLGIFGYTTIVANEFFTKKETLHLGYFCLLTAFSIAEFFALNGENVVIIIDSLNDHLDSFNYLLEKFDLPIKGLEYENRIIEMYSKLLSKCGVYSVELGEGSLTAIFLINTESIPDTNMEFKTILPKKNEYGLNVMEKVFLRNSERQANLNSLLCKAIAPKCDAMILFSKDLENNYYNPPINLSQSARLTPVTNKNKYLDYYYHQCKIYIDPSYDYEKKENSFLKEKTLTYIKRKSLFFGLVLQKHYSTHEIYEEIFLMFCIVTGLFDSLDHVTEIQRLKSYLDRIFYLKFRELHKEYVKAVFEQKISFTELGKMLITIYDEFISTKSLTSLIRIEDIHQLEN